MREQILNLKENELTNEKVNALIDFTIHTNDLLHEVKNETTNALGSVLESLKDIYERMNSLEQSREHFSEMNDTYTSIINDLNSSILNLHESIESIQ